MWGERAGNAEPVRTAVLTALIAAALLAPVGAAAASKPARKARPAAESAPAERVTGEPSAPEGAAGRDTSAASTDLTLRGGEEGTVFRSLTVQGEDRIHIEVERPALRLDMDPERAPGLDRATVQELFDRSAPDLLSPLLASSARESSPWIAHPWLAHFQEGAVARFHPSFKGVERWRLVVANARAESVAVFQGKGDPPREIAWDGRSTDGAPVLPGVTYSYVFEARDRAGNRRNFVGEGFRVDAFRHDSPAGPVLVFSGQELARPGGGAYGPDESPPIVIEAASAMNQVPADRTVRVHVTARSRDEAQGLSQRIVRWMSPYLLGDPARLQAETTVRSDAPAGAAVSIAAAD